MSEEMIEEFFDRFAHTSESTERVIALTELMNLKALPKRADDRRFEQGLDQWVRTANAPQVDPRTRLLAVAELIRATQQLKKRQPALIERLSPAFQEPLPPLYLLEDPEARLNVARACSMVSTAWLQAYRAASIATENAPKPRAEMMAALVANSVSISEVLARLTTPFEAVQPETENPADSLARRLTKTLEVFRTTVLGSLIEAGDDVGAHLDRFLRSTLASTGRPREETVQIELTREVVLTLHDLVRSRFSLATEPQTFLALQYCRGFFNGISWPKEVQNETNLLVQDVSEALVMLGRMGVPNQDLLNRLELVCGLKERARFVATTLAEKHPEIDESVRSWLRTGRLVSTVVTSNVLQESLLASIDEALGLALIETRALGDSSDAERRLRKSLEIFDPDLLPLLKGMAEQSGAMRAAIEDLAKRRELDLLGSVGEELEFMPKYFDALGPVRSGLVVVCRPAIVRKSGNAAAGAVVKKGLVE